MTRELVLVGAAGHASDVLGLIEDLQRAGEDLSVVGLLADGEPDVTRFSARGVRHLGPVEALADLPEHVEWVAAVGYPDGRRIVVERLTGLPHRSAALLHPWGNRTTGLDVGEGAVVLAGSSLSPYVRLGRHSLVSHVVGIGHDTVVGDYCSVMPGAMVSGDVVLGDGVLVGTGAVVLEKVRVGEGAVLGAGAVVTRDVPPGVTVRGVPAR